MKGDFYLLTVRISKVGLLIITRCVNLLKSFLLLLTALRFVVTQVPCPNVLVQLQYVPCFSSRRCSLLLPERFPAFMFSCSLLCPHGICLLHCIRCDITLSLGRIHRYLIRRNCVGLFETFVISDYVPGSFNSNLAKIPPSLLENRIICILACFQHL